MRFPVCCSSERANDALIIRVMTTMALSHSILLCCRRFKEMFLFHPINPI